MDSLLQLLDMAIVPIKKEVQLLDITILPVENGVQLLELRIKPMEKGVQYLEINIKLLVKLPVLLVLERLLGIVQQVKMIMTM